MIGPSDSIQIGWGKVRSKIDRTNVPSPPKQSASVNTPREGLTRGAWSIGRWILLVLVAA